MININFLFTFLSQSVLTDLSSFLESFHVIVMIRYGLFSCYISHSVTVSDVFPHMGSVMMDPGDLSDVPHSRLLEFPSKYHT